MNKRIIEILSYVIKEIKESSVDDIDLQFIVDVLAEQGFSDDDIENAMSWLNMNGETIDRIIQGPEYGLPKPVWRQLTEKEKESISPKAFSYLVHLRENDIVSDNAMETIIDRAMGLRLSALTVEEMQDLVAAVVLDFENSASNGYFQFTTNRLVH
jgi:uncharacterized protein Smg (DUF494 family)